MKSGPSACALSFVDTSPTADQKDCVIDVMDTLQGLAILLLYSICCMLDKAGAYTCAKVAESSPR